jgi:hypothetical protein
MITAGAVMAPSVIMDCRDKPGNDSKEDWLSLACRTP